jgi:hypothetical protein
MTEYVDITQLLQAKAHQLANNAVVKSPHFSLFQGTQALEINNQKLDSGIIPLTTEEEQFDCLKPRDLREVLWISDSVFRSVFTWLDNAGLSFTVFSCRYVEELLVNYTKNLKDGIQACKFGEVQIQTGVEYILVHKVLRSVILGVLHFVRLCLTLGQGGVVYEEEDMNTQTMNLNVLTLVESDDILKEIQSSIVFLQNHFPDSKDSMILQSILHILAKLIDVPYYLSMKVNKDSKFVNTSIVDSLKTYAELLKENVEYLDTLPEIPGCFSMGIQKRLDNRLPSRELINPRNEDYSSLSSFLNDLCQILEVSKRMTSHDIVNHALNFANKNHHVLARAIYPLFLIRDDRTILGEEQFQELLNEEMLRFSCWDTEYINTENELVKKKVADMLQQISVGYMEWFTVMNQNPCRQRQHLSRIIVTFDTLQSHSEQLEVSLKEVFQINEEFEYDGEMVPALPITSWVYYMKIDIMIQVVLRGFELDLYKLWEFHPMYWYVNYLIDNQMAIMDRVIKFNESKISKVAQMKNQLKKKKGDQKARYKDKIMRRQAQIPSIQLAIDTLKQTVVKYKVIQELCHLQLIQLEKYIANGIIKTPEFPFVQNQEILFRLRMKAFSTVGVPPCPEYTHYQRDLAHFLQRSGNKQRINELKSSVMNNIKTILEGIQSRDRTVGYNICSEDWSRWYKDLQRSCLGIVIQLGQEPEGKADVVTEAFHRYFPVVKAK